jgi:hypothetical protein
MPTVPEPSPSSSRPKGAAWRGLLLGGLLLVLVWLCAVIAEPYLIALALPQPNADEARSSAGGWANSNVWLSSQTAALAGVLLAGFVAKRLSAAKSWAAPIFLLVACLLYLFFAQFPATRSPWRVAYWSLGILVALALGAWLGKRSSAA